MNQNAKKNIKKWSLFTLRWGIAVVGIWYVVKNISIHDRVLISDPNGRPIEARLIRPAVENAAEYVIVDPSTGVERTIPRTDLLVRAGNSGEKVQVEVDQQLRTMETLALRVTLDEDRKHWPVVVGPTRTVVQKYLGSVPEGAVLTVQPSQLAGPRKMDVPYPLVDAGMKRIIAEANGFYLILAVLVFPVIFILVSIRWTMLIRMLGIQITGRRAFVLTMVGLFYNNFMPGSTGGDLIKAYYASKNTPKRTQVILSVLIDRVIGLVALIILGGTMAALQANKIPQCKKIAIVSACIIGLMTIGLVVYYTPFLRKITGLDFILSKLPMQKQVKSATAAMDLYGQHPWLMLGTLMLSFPVHITCIISATLAGKAFSLPLDWTYYWVAVPVIVLAGAIPISPQGAGVMEFFAILLTKRHGCTVTHAFLLTMSIRLVQMLWNLSGAIFVFRGGYHTPKEGEKGDEPTASTVSPPSPAIS